MRGELISIRTLPDRPVRGFDRVRQSVSLFVTFPNCTRKDGPIFASGKKVLTNVIHVL